MTDPNPVAGGLHDTAAEPLPANLDLLFREGLQALRTKAFDQAARLFSTILAHAPAHSPSQNKLAYAYLKQRDFPAAETFYRKVLAVLPRDADALHGLATALQEMGRLKEAVDLYESVLAVHPRKLSTLCNLGNALLNLGHIDQAIATFRKALRLKPDYHKCRLDYSAALFAMEDWAEAWRNFEARLDAHQIVPPFSFTQTSTGKTVPQDYWRNGPQPKSLLVVGEQGLGDNIQFARFLPELVRTGTAVTFMTDRKLFALFRTLDGPIDLVPRHEPISVPNVHAWVPLMSLPAVLGLRPGGLTPKIPYLAAEPDRVQRWKARLGPKGVKIGIAWSGNAVHVNDRNRSMALRSLLPLLDVDLTFVSLQKDIRPDDAAVLEQHSAILDVGDELTDFADTAALIAQLDLVISVDTSVAHLAGALGKPVWILLPFVPDWRWLQKREDSPFYPTARLFRQKTIGDWDEVITRVAGALRNFVANKAAQSPAIGNAPTAEIVEPRAMQARTVFESTALRIKTCKHGPMMYYANDRYVGRSLDLYGEFSEGESELFRQLIRPGMVVIDAGANIGVHTVNFAGAVQPNGRVIAIEPQRAIFQLLCGNLALNKCMNVEARNAALGSQPGTITVPRLDYTKEANFGGLGLGQWTQGEEVPVFTLDSLNLERCHFIKIDVEGMESAVLAGAEQTLGRLNPILYVENDRQENSAALIAFLLERNYRLYWHLPPLFNPANYFCEVDNVFGNTVSVNMLCIPKSKKIVVQHSREITSSQDTWHNG